MIRLLQLALLFYIGFTLFKMLVRKLSGKSGGPPQARTRDGEEMVRDPQCGTFVPRSNALNATVRGERHYFCSAACRDAFLNGK